MTEREPLKILLATPVPPPYTGGIINWTRMIQRGLQCHPEVLPSFVDTARRYKPIPGLDAPSRLMFGSAQALRDTYRIYRRLKADRPDLLHLCTSGGLATMKDILVLKIARRLGVPRVIQYHMGRLPGISGRGNLEWRWTCRAASLANAAATLDTQSEECLQAALPGQRVVTLPNMVELDVVDRLRGQIVARGEPKSAVTNVALIALLSPAKGVREMVEACVRLAEHGVVLHLIGPIHRAFQLELTGLAARGGRPDLVRYYGPVDHDESLRHMLAADIFALPSYTEGAPLTVLEAMACGTPVVATPVGAIPDMLDFASPAPCGLRVEPQDVGSLTAALRRLVLDPALRRDLTQRARARVEAKYSLPHACNQLLGLWQATVAARRAAGSPC